MGAGGVLLIVAVVTGIIIFLMAQQSRIKKQIEEMHRHDNPDTFPPSSPSSLPPVSGTGETPATPIDPSPVPRIPPVTGPGPSATPPSGSHDTGDAGDHP